MAVTNVFGIYAADIGGTTVPLRAQNLANNFVEVVIGSSGDVVAGFAAVMSQNPMISCQTTSLKIFLDQLGTPWKALSTAASFYFRKHLASGVRSAAGDFIKLTCAAGLLVPRPITFAQGSVASMGFDYYPVSADGTVPYTVASGVGNPALTTLLAAQWTAGPVKINAAVPSSSRFTGVQSGSIDPGITVTSLGGDGEVFPSHVHVNTARPVITLSLSDADVLEDIGVEGVAQGATASTIYLWKLLEGAARVAKASTVHIAVSVNEGTIVVPGLGGTHPAAIGSTIRIIPTFDGTNPNLAISTVSAIPAAV